MDLISNFMASAVRSVNFQSTNPDFDPPGALPATTWTMNAAADRSHFSQVRSFVVALLLD
jgi:hypothetical protein